MNVYDLIEKSKKFDADKRDDICIRRDMAFSNSMELYTPCMGGMVMTDHSLAQIGAKLGPTMYGKGSTRSINMEHLRHLPKELAALELNYFLWKDQGGNRMMVRAYQKTCRAVVDGRYPDVKNTEVLETLQTLLEDPGQEYGVIEEVKNRGTRSVVTPDGIFVRMFHTNLNREEHGGALYAGWHIQNDETGGGAVEIGGAIMNTECDNSLRLPNLVRITHQYRVNGLNGLTSTEWLKNQIAVALINALKTTPPYVEAYFEAQTKALPNLGKLITAIAKENHWGEVFKSNVGIGTNGDETLAGLLNGITYAAQRVKDPAETARLELFAGSLLVDNSGLFARASKLANADLEEVRIR